MSPDDEGKKSREQIKVAGKKSLEELRVRERICPFWIHETVIDIWRPQKEKEPVNMCMATQRMVCLRDYKNYDNCEYYLQFKKGDEENVLPSMNAPRYPVSLHPEDVY